MTVLAPHTAATFGQRARYGWRIVQRAIGVLRSRIRPATRRTAVVVPLNAMFDSALLPQFDRERAELEAFDLYLYDVMNDPRLRGQIVFEYGTLLRTIDKWVGLRVLDIGTGRSTLPRWMSRAGASVTTFDLPSPVEATRAGFHDRVDAVVGRSRGVVRPVSGSMHALPFATGSLDLVTSLSVLEHLDTDLPARRHVPYDEQQRRLANALDEMMRVTRPGGCIYLTSECCDYRRATTDNWRGAYYYDDGPSLSAAWPVDDVPRLFYDYVAAHGFTLVEPCAFRAPDIGLERHWTWRGAYFGGFSLLARKQ